MTTIKLNNVTQQWLGKTKDNYTHQVENPENFVRFDLTEGDCWFKNKLIKWIKELSIDTINHYPDATNDNIKELLSCWLHIRKENIAVGNGSDELIDLIPNVFLNSGDKVIIPIPCFFRFIDASRKAGTEIVLVKLNQKDGFEWNKTNTLVFLEKLQDPKIKLIWLASPNNPTGVNVPNKILNTIIKSGKIVILDKVLNGFTKELREASRMVWKHNNVIIISGFSKTFGLPGTRFGFAIANPRIINVLEKKRLPFNISGPTQQIIENLLLDLISKRITINEVRSSQKEKIRLINELAKNPSIKIGSHSKTNFLLIKHNQRIDLFNELLKKKILVTNLSRTPGIINQGFVRISIKTRKENELLLKALREIN